MDIDDPQITIKRAEIIKKKKVLNTIYTRFYKTFKDLSELSPNGKKVELGSGSGFIKEIIPDCITSDIMKLPGCDMTFAAEKMPFKKDSVACFYLLNTFHHIKNPKKALSEFQRCLKRGGSVVMIEPYNSIWGRFIYKFFHHELFDHNADWKIKEKGYLSSANGALPWIVFIRDRTKFEKLFPNLKIVEIIPHTPLLYLLSGGFTLPQIIPSLFIPLVNFIENIIYPLNDKLGMFVTIMLKKE